MSKKLVSLYVVRSQDGKYFRSRGQRGIGDRWVPEISEAKIYTKIGTARGIRTYYANHYPSFGIPDVVELPVYKEIVLDETQNVLKAQKKKEKELEKRKAYELEMKKKEAEVLKKELSRIESEISGRGKLP